jgi:hypothetical protein
MPYKKENDLYNFYDQDDKLIHSSDSIAIVFHSMKGILKHGPTPEVNKWATEERQKSGVAVSVIESRDWDVKDLNKKLEKKY